MVGFDGFFGSINVSALKPFFKSVTWKLVLESNNLGKCWYWDILETFPCPIKPPKKFLGVGDNVAVFMLCSRSGAESLVYFSAAVVQSDCTAQ